MKRIITFIAALAFVSGGIISAQEQEREQVQEQEPIREYSKFRFGLEGGGGFRLGKISNDVLSFSFLYTYNSCFSTLALAGRPLFLVIGLAFET